MNRLHTLLPHTLAPMALALVCLATPALAGDKIKTVIGSGPNGINGHGVNLPGLNTEAPGGGQIAIDAQGNVYILTSGSFQSGMVYKLNTDGTVNLIAGDGSWYPDGETGDAIHVELNAPTGIAVDNANPANVYIADTGNCVVRKVDQETGKISTVAGIYETPSNNGPDCGSSGDGGWANAALLSNPAGLAVDPIAGDLYIADGNGVRKVAGGSPTGTISTVTTTTGLSIALDTSVTPINIFLGDSCNVEEFVGATGKLYNVAGSMTACGYVNGSPATMGTFNTIKQLYVTGNGVAATIQVADSGNNSIRQFTVASSAGVPQPGPLATIAGSAPGAACSPTSPTALGDCFTPSGIVDDADGHYYIADEAYYSIHKVTAATAAVATPLGWDPFPYPPLGSQTLSNPPLYSNPLLLKNSAAQPSLFNPFAVFADPASPTIYVGGGYGQAVYGWNSATNRISDVAGNGVQGFAGDGMLADSPQTELSLPSGMAKDTAGNLYIADDGDCRIRVVNAGSGIISTFAGGGSNPANPCGYSGDGLPATEAQFNQPNSIAFDSHGNLFVADEYNCAIRKIDAQTHIVTTFAGAGPSSCAFSGDGGPASAAELAYPASVSFDGAGNLYIADLGNNVVREVLAGSGIIQTVAGNYGADGIFAGDGPGLQQSFSGPTWVKADPNGNLFLIDGGNQIIRWVTPSGQLITFAGSPPPLYGGPANAGFFGDFGPALDALFNNPTGLDQDSYGNFYVADQGNSRIREITAFPGYGLSTAGLTFASQLAGTASPAQTITLSAIGPTNIRTIILSHGFTETDNCTNTVLADGQTCQIHVTFNPKTAGSASGVLKIYSNALLTANNLLGLAGNPDTVTLSGTAHN